MKYKKKREYQSSELVQSLARLYGFEDKLKAFEIKDFLGEYLDETFFKEIIQVDFKDQVVSIRIQSDLMRHDFNMRKSFFLKKFKEKFGDDVIKEVFIF